MFSIVAHDATVTRHGHVRAREGEIFEGINHNPQPEPETPVTCCHPGGDFLGGEINIGHHIFEFMTRLPLIESRRVVVWDDLPRPCLDLIELAGFEVDQAPRSARFDEITVYSSPVGRFEDQSPFCYAPAVHGLRALIPQSQNPPTARAIYCARRAHHRTVLNDTEVEQALESVGIETVLLERMSIADQIAIMRAATLVIMPMGAGSAFSIFTDAPVIELAQPGISGEFGTKMWATVLRRPWARLNGYPTRRGRDADYTIDVNDLLRLVSEMRGTGRTRPRFSSVFHPPQGTEPDKR